MAHGVISKNSNRVVVKEDHRAAGKKQQDFPGANIYEYFNHPKCISADFMKTHYGSRVHTLSSYIHQCCICTVKEGSFSCSDSRIFDFEASCVETSRNKLKKGPCYIYLKLSYGKKKKGTDFLFEDTPRKS